jgi:hypothetical protein
MVENKVAAKYPRLYHMSEKRNWDSICRHGLLSTTALLDLFEYKQQSRFEIESQLRIKEYVISHPIHGTAFVRDQDPMRDRPEEGIYLDKCLVGITAQEWFEFLNRKVFFWTDQTGLGYMLGAKLYRSRSHYIITLDTQSLLARYSDKVSLSSLNSGSLYRKQERSLDTFQSLDQYHRMRWVTELAVDYRVPDFLNLTVSVDECISQRASGKSSCKVLKRIWPA